MLRLRTVHIVVLLASIIGFSSCEKVIEPNLRDADPILVIEGTVTNRIDTQVVRISKSVAFNEQNKFPGVSGATVTVDDGTGRVFTFRERRPGVYSARNFTGRTGRTYKLKVVVEGKEYTASSTMPNQVNLDSLGVSVNRFFGEERRSINVFLNDPPLTKNYYRFLLAVNGKPSENIFVFDDYFNDGKTVIRELLDFDLAPQPGDRIDVQMQCIDAFMFKYWQGIDQNESRGGATTTPANPVSNISNGALGYFSAHTKQEESVFIP